MKKLIICGIGSRETPPHILNEMTKIGTWIKTENHILRSGHAQGADFAFEQGAQERCIAYIPWNSFFKDLKSNALKFVVDDYYSNILNEFTDKYHPTPYKLTNISRKLMNRNVCQVLGLKTDNHSDVIICYTKDGKDSGGTGQAMRIAKAYNIPILNMFYDEYNTSDKVIKELNKLKNGK